MTVEHTKENSSPPEETQKQFHANSFTVPDLQNEARTVLPSFAMHNGGAVELNCNGVTVPGTRKDFLGEDSLQLVKVKIRDLSDVQSNAVPEGHDPPGGEVGQTDEHEASGEEQEEITEQPLSPDKSESYEEETRCGFGPWKPQWLQKLASKKSYVLVYGLIGMFTIAVSSYFVSTISTIEKRFKIPSRTSGIIASAWDFGGLSSSLVLSYLGSRGHKTRWVACGTSLMGLSCFMQLVPHLIFGPGQDALELTLEYEHSFGITNINSSIGSEESRQFVCQNKYQDEEDCSTGSSSYIPSTIFIISFFCLGIGGSMYYTLGVSYLDDNVRKNKSPFLLAIWQCLRMLGPTIGFLYGSYALHKYVDTSVHPTITREDPRWIGAWWHGWGPLGTVCVILAAVLAMFPRKLPRAAQRTIAAGDTGGLRNTTTRSLADFKVVLKRLAKNKVLLFNSFSSVFYIFGLTGYWTFMPKYMETQFRQSASKSSLITGSVGLIFSGLGIMLSGIVISKFRPRARYLAAWNVAVETLDVIGHFSYAFLSCPIDDLHGAMKPDHSWNLTAECNSDCDCGPTVKFSPVCSIDGSTTFYSACHAGCTAVDMINGTKMFDNCSCIGEDGMGRAMDGTCPVDCTTNFTIFLVVQCVMRLFSASGRAGNTIIQFRCVDQDDKSVSIGFTEALLCGLAFIPGPILYGMLLDSACIVWGQTCGKTGNCWLYDGERLGFLLNFTASGFLLGGALLDVGVWYNVKDLQIYDKKDEKNDTKKKKNSKKKNMRSSINELNERSESPLL